MKTIDLPFEHIKPVDYDRVITGLQETNKELFNDLEESVEKIAEHENDIDTIKEILHEVGGCDGEEGYAKGWDDAVNEVERQMLEHLANYNNDEDISTIELTGSTAFALSKRGTSDV